MIKFLGKLLKTINVFVVVIYLLACLIPFLPAGRFWWIAVMGLVFPLLFFMIAGFLIGWIIARSRWYLLSLVALLLSWKQLPVMAGLNMPASFAIAKSDKTLRVLTWNISTWGETNKSSDGRFTVRPLMIDLISNQKADVLCFQEFRDTKGVYYHDSIIPLLAEEGYRYSYYVPTVIHGNALKMGVAIISKYPFVDTANFKYGEDDFAEHLIYADILFNQQKIRIFTTHLQSVRFDEQEYAALRKIKQTDEAGLKDSKTIVRKLRDAYKYRGAEADLVKQKIEESPYPVIICGDFNDVPNSYTYFTIKGNLQDAFLKKGMGLGRTFQYLSPTLRIDYI